MADPASLALGLAGLGGLFSTCLDLFDLIEKGLHQGQDLAFLAVRINVERTKLLLWGERAGVWPTSRSAATQAHPQMHTALQRKEVLGALIGILETMKVLFDDSIVLRDRYLSSNNIQGTKTAPRASTDLLTAATAVAEAVGDQAKHLQKSLSPTQRIRWVLKDKASAEKLVYDLRQLNDDLVSILPPLESAQIPAISRTPARSTRPNICTKNPPLLPANPEAGSSLLSPVPHEDLRKPSTDSSTVGQHPTRMRAILRQLKIINETRTDGIELVPVGEDCTRCYARIAGPDDTPYARGTFYLSVDFPPEYPYKAPSIQFLTRIYHVNVDVESGEICLEKNLEGFWRPTVPLAKVLSQIRSLIGQPNSDEPFSPDVAHIYFTDLDMYNRLAEYYTVRYATPDQEHGAIFKK